MKVIAVPMYHLVWRMLAWPGTSSFAPRCELWHVVTIALDSDEEQSLDQLALKQPLFPPFYAIFQDHDTEANIFETQWVRS
jgi:hypothetical protein